MERSRSRASSTRGGSTYREETFARQKELGVVPQDADLTKRPDEIPAWDSFSPEQQTMLARQMEVFAGFTAQVDHEVGRLIDYVALPAERRATP